MRNVEIQRRFVNQPDDILACGHAADRPSQNVVKHQGGDAEFGQRAAHGLFDHAIDAAAHEHAAALHVEGADGVGEQHDAQNEPGRGLPDVGFRFATGVISRGGKIVQNDRGRTPEGNKTEERGGCDQNARNTVPLSALNRRVIGRATHSMGLGPV